MTLLSHGGGPDYLSLQMVQAPRHFGFPKYIKSMPEILAVLFLKVKRVFPPCRAARMATDKVGTEPVQWRPRVGGACFPQIKRVVAGVIFA
jgi:hypothetical protein